MNKIGGDKLISVYWFLILIIIAGGIVAMVNVFYGSDYDVREVEAEIMSRKIADCVVHGGEMDQRLITGGVFRDSFRDNFMDLCKLTFEKKGEFDPDEYYLEINFYRQTNLKTSAFLIVEGNLNWKGDCDFQEEENERLVKCSNDKFYAVDKEKKVYLVDILSIVRKTEQNAK